MGEFVILMQFTRDEMDEKKKKIYAVTCLPDLPSTVKKCAFDRLLTFCNFDELQTKDISWKSFPIKFEKCFPSIKKESR